MDPLQAVSTYPRTVRKALEFCARINGELGGDARGTPSLRRSRGEIPGRHALEREQLWSA